MRIALLSPTYPPDVGGLATSAARLARMLAATGHQVHAFAPTSSLTSGHVARSSDGNLMISRFGAQRRTANSRELVRQAEALAPGRTAMLIPNGVETTLFTAKSAKDAEIKKTSSRPLRPLR